MPQGIPTKRIKGPLEPPPVTADRWPINWNKNWGPRCVGGNDYGQTNFMAEKVYPQCRLRGKYPSSQGPLCGCHLNLFVRYGWLRIGERNRLVRNFLKQKAAKEQRQILLRQREDKAVLQGQVY